MTKLIDLTNQSMGASNPFQTRNVSQITHLGIHHSATATGSQMVFENHWKTLGWRNGGYSEIILRNGDVELCYVPTVVTNGISGHNLTTYNICVVGNGSFTPEQETALDARIRTNMQRFNVPVARVMGHNEFSGTATSCPARNMAQLRTRISTDDSNNSETIHIVKAGETLTSIANQYGVTVDAIVQANNLTNPNAISIGQRLIIPTTTAPTQSFFPATQTVGTGLVDTLNSIQVDSSFANRQRIALANGISNYTGTVAQNNQMLSLLNQGRLVRP